MSNTLVTVIARLLELSSKVEDSTELELDRIVIEANILTNAGNFVMELADSVPVIKKAPAKETAIVAKEIFEEKPIEELGKNKSGEVINRKSVNYKTHTKLLTEPRENKFKWRSLPAFDLIKNMLVGNSVKLTLEETHPDSTLGNLQSAMNNCASIYFGPENIETHLAKDRSGIIVIRTA